MKHKNNIVNLYSSESFWGNWIADSKLSSAALRETSKLNQIQQDN